MFKYSLLLFILFSFITNGMSMNIKRGNVNLDSKLLIDEPSFQKFTETPNNTAGLAGDEIRMHCKSDSSNTLTWFYFPIGSTRYDVVIGECVVNSEYADRIRSDFQGFGHCDLIVTNAQYGDAGTYSCFQPHNSVDPAEGAQLAVLASEPSCTYNTTDLFEFEYVELRCIVNYTNNISPMLINWIDDSGQPVDATSDETQPGYTLTRLVLQARPPALRVYRSRTYFSTPVGLPSTATNTPSYTYIWDSPATQVKSELMIPQNTVGAAGSYVNMTCRRRSQSIAWTLIPQGGTESRLIASNCVVVPSYVGIYEVDTALYACNLLIYPLQPQHEGTYTCQDVFSTEGPFSATLRIG